MVSTTQRMLEELRPPELFDAALEEVSASVDRLVEVRVTDDDTALE